MKINVTINGAAYERDVEPRTLLVHFLRDDCGQTGTHVGCDTSSCGCCRPTDGRSAPSKDLPTAARCIRSSRRSGISTDCSAATARRACC